MRNKAHFGPYMNWRRWLLLAVGVIGFALFCVTLALFYTHWTLAPFGTAVRQQSIIDIAVLTTALVVPSLTLLGLKLFEVHFINLELGRMASTDILTDCLNRRALLDVVNAHMKQQDASSAPIGGAFLVIDVDHFKGVNDSLGHVGGDAALSHIAAVTKRAVRVCDLVARIGGEEFAVFLPGISVEDAHEIAERVVEAVRSTPFTADGKSVPLAVSLGGALFVESKPFEWLYKVADGHLYMAKQNGRDRAIMPPIAA